MKKTPDPDFPINSPTFLLSPRRINKTIFIKCKDTNKICRYANECVNMLLYILTGIKPINKKNYEIIKYLLYSNLRPL